MLKVKKCWHHLLYANVISFFVISKCQKLQKIDANWWKLANIGEIRNSTWVISMKFSEKMWPMIILEVTKNEGLTLSLEDTLFEKPQGSIWPPPPPPSRFRVNSWDMYFLFILIYSDLKWFQIVVCPKLKNIALIVSQIGCPFFKYISQNKSWWYPQDVPKTFTSVNLEHILQNTFSCNFSILLHQVCCMAY